MHFVKVNVLRDETATMNIAVAAWEVPVLEAKHGEERLTIGETVEVKGREWPTDARSEMQRLSKLYGVTGAGDEALSFAERVYGAGSMGVKALERAMKDARDAAKPKRAAKGADLVGQTN